MIKFFRKIRQNLLIENKLSKYLLYAIGEIILVVIGILIALQINNNNETAKIRAKELHYLKNVKADLTLTIQELEQFINTRNSQIKSANNVIEHYNGKPISNLNSFNSDVINVYTWTRFFQINNTFQELTYSGNLAIISNDSIKNGLLNLEALYKKIKYLEDHFRYDAEVNLYNPSYDILDINPMGENYLYKITNGELGSQAELDKSRFEEMLLDIRQKNGFAFAVIEFSKMNIQLISMKNLASNLVKTIDNELNY
ncbi:MAG: hypothetical protein KJP09_08145 [Bacteroidia bacterium]|nr:hypothetical protein [Bacteroidia bacterium]NND11464.1 hypothetical protein [Flavobacteriaceae bacterium]NNE16545.1 hypothetical protein [Saprospiraceae bacterium]